MGQYTNLSQVKKAQTVQNLAARLVTDLPKTTRQTDLLKACGWLNITSLAKYHYLCQMWKTVRWGSPYMKDRIVVLDEDRLQTTKPRLQITAASYRWNSVTNWNMLPPHIRSATSIKQFKNSLKIWLRCQ